MGSKIEINLFMFVQMLVLLSSDGKVNHFSPGYFKKLLDALNSNYEKVLIYNLKFESNSSTAVIYNVN